MSNATAGALAEIDRLEQLTDAVLEALTHMRAQDVERLVLEQCQSIQRIKDLQPDAAGRARMTSIAMKVSRQQVLIAQALKTADYFIRTVNQAKRYNEVG